MFLLREGLWDIINNLSTPLRREDDLQKNQCALSTIILCLEDSQLSLVRGTDSAQQCWQALSRAHIWDSTFSDNRHQAALSHEAGARRECVQTPGADDRDVHPTQRNGFGVH